MAQTHPFGSSYLPTRTRFAGVTELAYVPALRSGLCGFKSRRRHQIFVYTEDSLMTLQAVRFGRGFDSRQVHQIMGLQRFRRVDEQGDEMAGGRLPRPGNWRQRKTISAKNKVTVMSRRDNAPVQFALAA